MSAAKMKNTIHICLKTINKLHVLTLAHLFFRMRDNVVQSIVVSKSGHYDIRKMHNENQPLDILTIVLLRKQRLVLNILLKY